MAREHLYMLIVDREGNLQEGAEVRILQPHTLDLISVPIYESNEGENIIGNPFEANNGIIDIYVNEPVRVRIGLRVGSSTEQFIEDIDIGRGGDGEGGAHDHSGGGADSTMVGTDSNAPGDNSTALGVNASANANRSVALGYNATGAQADAIAIGYQANSNGDRVIVIGSESSATASGAVVVGSGAEASGSHSVAIGRLSVATSANSGAIGHGASAAGQDSFAIGPNASASDDNQIVLGTANHSVYAPGVMVLATPGGRKYEVRVSDTGVLYSSTDEQANDSPTLAPEDTEFSGGVGNWTGSVTVTESPDISPNQLLTIDPSDSPDALSGSISVSEGDSLIGHAWAYTPVDYDVSLALEFLDSEGAVILESAPLPQTSIPLAWYKLSTRDEVPVGAVQARLKIFASIGDNASGTEMVYIETAGIHIRE